MAEETEETEETSPETGEEPEQPEPETDPAAEVEKWKALARKNEEQAKKNAEAAKRLQELEDEKKSEAEKLQDRIAELEPSAHEAKKLRVALRKGLTETQAKRLVGDTVEELEADADDLIESFKSEGKPSASPRENLKSGAAPDTEPEEDPDKIADRILSRNRI